MPVVAPIVPESEPIEEVIGDVMAAAALALNAAVMQWQADGQVIGTPAIKQKSRVGGSFISQLWELQEATHGELDFDKVARVYGTQALRKRCNGGGYSAAAGDILIDETLRILHQVTVTMQLMDQDEPRP
jgi:hypothetical protein